MPVPSRHARHARHAPWLRRALAASLSGLMVAGVAAAGAASSAAAGASQPAALVSNVERISGATRIDTAIAASRDQFPGAASAAAVVLARSDEFPDALAGGPLAAEVRGPVLLTAPGRLDPAVGAEISRVAPKGATVYILGGPSAVKSGVDDAVQALGYTPKRVYGADRYATAVAVAHEMGDPATVFEATGLNFPDALAAGPAAIAAGGVVLLTAGNKQAPATAAYLAAHPGGVRYALGGPAAAADPSALAFIGRDRYETAAEVADQFFRTPTTIGIATGLNFPDALAAGPVLGAKGAPLLLVPPTGPLPPAPTAEVLFDFGTARGAMVFGGTASVSDGVANQVGVLAGAGPQAAAASVSAAWTGQFGVRAERLDAAGGSVTRTLVFDGSTGAVTVYQQGAAAKTVDAASPTRAQLNALPIKAAELEAAVNDLYADFDAKNGIDYSDPDARFFLNAEQIVLNPIASPTLRLATYAALAGSGYADVSSAARDSSGRAGISIWGSIGGQRIGYIFDPKTLLPLEDTVLDAHGALVSRRVVQALSTTGTRPGDPYKS